MDSRSIHNSGGFHLHLLPSVQMDTSSQTSVWPDIAGGLLVAVMCVNSKLPEQDPLQSFLFFDPILSNYPIMSNH